MSIASDNGKDTDNKLTPKLDVVLSLAEEVQVKQAVEDRICFNLNINVIVNLVTVYAALEAQYIRCLLDHCLKTI